MADFRQWLDDNRLDYTMAGSTCLIFTPPPAREDCVHSCIVPNDAHGLLVAKRFRGYGWAAHVLKGSDRAAAAIKWLQWLGYGRGENGRPVLHLPREGARCFGDAKVDLVRVAEAIVLDPTAASRDVAAILTAHHGRKIGRQAANRAMMAVGWGPEERLAFKSGATGAPKLSRG